MYVALLQASITLLQGHNVVELEATRNRGTILDQVVRVDSDMKTIEFNSTFGTAVLCITRIYYAATDFWLFDELTVQSYTLSSRPAVLFFLLFFF